MTNRLVSIDFGLARIGIAISDERQVIAFPLEVVACSKKVSTTIQSVLEVFEKAQKNYECIISQIIIGLPLMMNGSHGLLADETKNFSELLKAKVSVPVILWDERLTTVQAERILREAGLSRKKRTKHVDNVAAVVILQNYLDYLKFKSGD